MDVRAGQEDLEQLFAHQDWVRALALRLCGDAAAADDLVQDTWIEALRGRAGVRSVRAWLGGIVRHRWRRDRLRTVARTEREADVARPSAMPSPEGMLAQAGLQRRVLAAVASLDEASRTVVLLRYYEGLSGEVIAARLAVPGSTVRNRLARAHGKLRARLDREYGGASGAWSVLLVPGGASHTVSLSTGIGVAMKTKLLVVGMVVAAGTAWLWLGVQPDAAVVGESASPTHATVHGTGTVTDRSAASSSEPGQDRAAVVTVATDPSAPLLLWGEIRGPTASEVSKGSIWAVDAAGARRELSPGASSTYSAFGLQPGKLQIFATVRGFVPHESELDLRPGSGPIRHDIVLASAFVVPVRFVDRTTGLTLKQADPGGGSGLATIATRTRPARIENLVRRLPWSSDAGRWYPRQPFGTDDRIPAGSDGLVEILPPLPVHVSCVLRDTVIESRLVHGNEETLVFEIDPTELEKVFARVVLRCVDSASGRPVEGASVRLGFQDSTGRTVKTAASGETALDRVPPGLQELEIRAPGFGAYGRMVRIEPRGTTDLGAIELRPATRIEGRVVDLSGEPIDAHVTVLPLRQCEFPRDTSVTSSHPCLPGGTFRIENVERGPCRVVVRASGFAVKAMDVDTGQGDVSGLEVRMERGTPVRFSVEKDGAAFVTFVLLDAAGTPIFSAIANRLHSPEVELAPGGYQCLTLVDQRVARREGLEVGSTKLVHEVQGP